MKSLNLLDYGFIYLILTRPKLTEYMKAYPLVVPTINANPAAHSAPHSPPSQLRSFKLSAH